MDSDPPTRINNIYTILMKENCKNKNYTYFQPSELIDRCSLKIDEKDDTKNCCVQCIVPEAKSPFLPLIATLTPGDIINVNYDSTSLTNVMFIEASTTLLTILDLTTLNTTLININSINSIGFPGTNNEEMLPNVITAQSALFTSTNVLTNNILTGGVINNNKNVAVVGVLDPIGVNTARGHFLVTTHLVTLNAFMIIGPLGPKVATRNNTIDPPNNITVQISTDDDIIFFSQTELFTGNAVFFSIPDGTILESGFTITFGGTPGEPDFLVSTETFFIFNPSP